MGLFDGGEPILEWMERDWERFARGRIYTRAKSNLVLNKIGICHNSIGQHCANRIEEVLQ